MNLKKVKDLDIAKNPFDYSRDIVEDLNYKKWVEYVNEQSDYFTWREMTVEGIETLANIEKVPESFRERVLLGHNKVVCYAEYDPKKKYYGLNVGYVKEYKRIRISFERPVTLQDLKRFLAMAKHLDALLLNNGTEIIDEQVLESLA